MSQQEMFHINLESFVRLLLGTPVTKNQWPSPTPHPSPVTCAPHTNVPQEPLAAPTLQPVDPEMGSEAGAEETSGG